MINKLKREIEALYRNVFNEAVKTIEKLPISGSSRTYLRVSSEKYTAVATYNTDIKENNAFLYLSKHFKEKGMNVPEVYTVNEDHTIYLQEDLGDETLFDRTQKSRNKDHIPIEVIDLYKKAIEQLADLQINGSKGIDYSVCYPREAFDKQSMIWDLNYFKYNFLKLTSIYFDEQLLENDFNTCIDFLLKARTNFFLYRDFKSLNIMLRDKEVYFIDYQGGRKGALHYDIASLVHEAKADIPITVKNELLDHYINYTGKLTKINKQEFLEFYHAYSLIRILQALGTYGYRGLFERKQHYIDSIPLRLKRLNAMTDEIKILEKLPELKRILHKLPQLEIFNHVSEKEKLTIQIKSFSYKKGIPIDTSGNGGGHVFDCRFINNPGRIEKYKHLCGKDQEVIDFLQADEQVHMFFDAVKQIVSSSVNNYQSRNFKDLSVNFGCTGGQHRSVYFAERTAEYLKENYEIIVELIHTEGF